MVQARVKNMSSACVHHITLSWDCHLYMIDTLCMSLGPQMQNCLIFSHAILYLYTISKSHHPLFANSSYSVSAMDAKLSLITGRCTGSVIRR